MLHKIDFMSPFTCLLLVIILYYMTKDAKSWKQCDKGDFGWGSVCLNCCLQRQTALHVGFTDRELKLLYPSELSSNPPDSSGKNTVILPCGTWELLVYRLKLWCFNITAHHNGQNRSKRDIFQPVCELVSAAAWPRRPLGLTRSSALGLPCPARTFVILKP